MRVRVAREMCQSVEQKNQQKKSRQELTVLGRSNIRYKGWRLRKTLKEYRQFSLAEVFSQKGPG